VCPFQQAPRPRRPRTWHRRRCRCWPERCSAQSARLKQSGAGRDGCKGKRSNHRKGRGLSVGAHLRRRYGGRKGTLRPPSSQLGSVGGNELGICGLRWRPGGGADGRPVANGRAGFEGLGGRHVDAVHTSASKWDLPVTAHVSMTWVLLRFFLFFFCLKPSKSPLNFAVTRN
jgi:hypothetical protein